MRKSGDAAIHMKELDMTYLAGGPIVRKEPVQIFETNRCNFIDDLSKVIRADKRVRDYPDVAAFSFYCRKANIQRLREQYMDGNLRMGRGLAFHIAPSNIPVNFAFTYLFGLLSGNANVVRVSSKQYEQVRIICDAINCLFLDDKYHEIKEQTAIVRFEKDKNITNYLSKIADVRVIWGGNETIASIQESPLGFRGKDIVFADRYSIAAINSEAILAASDKEITHLSGQFYNDTYLMDQNACSTPHLILWQGTDEKQTRQAQDRFWNAIYLSAKKYDLADIRVSDKYAMLCDYAMKLPDMQIKRYENLVYVVTLPELPESITNLRGRFGLFFQHDVHKLEEVVPYIDKSVQSFMFYGVERNCIMKMILENHLTGIDRVVEFGKSLEIGVQWDGYDLMIEMSRMIGR